MKPYLLELVCTSVMTLYAYFCTGLPNPKFATIFDGLTISNGFYTSKDFLPLVCSASKPGRIT